jgi:hypothetical protein
MEKLNLVLKYRLAGEDEFQFRSASRIRIDGSGSVFA